MLPYWTKIIEKMRAGKKLTIEEGNDLANEIAKFDGFFNYLINAITKGYATLNINEQELIDQCFKLYNTVKFNGN